ncbi:hypothetical protein ABZ883_14830 [Streptomyces sp. NPDC046977]|uniref:hypothetical protein n=1 Tax=Streptomyces sp. NPDC046977 TaxID=3154703 RepID=UPI00340A5E16
MPPYQSSDLTPERRSALEAELVLYQSLAKRAEMDLKKHVAKASAEGLTLRDIARVLKLQSPTTASRWRDEAQQE